MARHAKASGTTGRPKGVEQTHANIMANIHHLNCWIPYREGGVYLHAAPIFHILDFLFMFAAPAFGACQVTIPKFSPQSFCETVERERVNLKLVQGYGLTEAGFLTGLQDHERTEDRLMSCGRACPRIDVRVVD